jgi:hypothetical protein
VREIARLSVATPIPMPAGWRSIPHEVVSALSAGGREGGRPPEGQKGNPGRELRSAYEAGTFRNANDLARMTPPPTRRCALKPTSPAGLRAEFDRPLHRHAAALYERVAGARVVEDRDLRGGA